jgi:hypothetical protein
VDSDNESWHGSYTILAESDFGFYSLIQLQFSGLHCVVQWARKVHILAGNNPNPTLIISIFQHHYFCSCIFPTKLALCEPIVCIIIVGDTLVAVKDAVQSVCKQRLCLHFGIQNIEFYSTTIFIFMILEYNKLSRDNNQVLQEHKMK